MKPLAIFLFGKFVARRSERALGLNREDASEYAGQHSVAQKLARMSEAGCSRITRIVALCLLAATGLLAQPTITTTALPNPIMARAVSGSVWTMTATGGTAPYTWSVSAGALPTGLALASGTGVISNTASAAGSSTFTVLVTDAATLTASQSYTITAQNAIGVGCTTATVIDHDCDYYGVGSAIGPDADDADPTVNTAASMIAKYGTLGNFFTTVKGWSPTHIWYLSLAGNNSTCAVDNPALPCATWAYVHTHVTAGEALVARAGLYNENTLNYGLPANGTSGHPTIVTAYPGESVNLNRSGASCSNNGWEGQPSYMVFDGFILSDTCAPPAEYQGTAILFAGGSLMQGVTIQNNEIIAFYDGYHATATHVNFTILNNSIHDQVGGEHNIYIGTATGSSGACGGCTPKYAGTSTGVLVQGNLLYDTGRDNFHDNGNCNACTITGNIMYSANMSPGGGSASLQLQNGWNHSTVSNNVLFNSSGYAIGLDTYDDGDASIIGASENYNLFANNTIMQNGFDASGQNLSGNGFTTVFVSNVSSAQGPIDMGHNTYANNVFAVDGNAGGGVVRYIDNGNSASDFLSTDTWTNNINRQFGSSLTLWYGTSGLGTSKSWAFFGSTAATFTGMLQSDPLFAAWAQAWYSTPAQASMWNLRTQAGSPAIGAGTLTGAPATDITGALRGSSPDIGAYQVGPVGTPVYLRASGPAAVQVMGASNNGVSPLVLCTGNPPVNASTPCSGTPLPHNFPTTCGTSTTCYCNPNGLAITTGNHASAANGLRECAYVDATHLSEYYVSGSPYSSPVTSNGNWASGANLGQNGANGANAALQQVGLLQVVNTVAAPAGWLDGPTGPVMRRLALTPLNGLTSLILTGCPSACVATVTTSYDPTTGNFPITVGGSFSITGTGTLAIDEAGTGTTLQSPYTVASIGSTGWVSSAVAITGATNGNYTNSNLACGPAATPNDTIGGTQSCTVVSQIATTANAQWSGMLAISAAQHTDTYPDYQSYFDGGKNAPAFGLMGLYQVAALEFAVNRGGASGAFWLAELEYAVNNVEREAGVNWTTALYSAGGAISQYAGFSPPGFSLVVAEVYPYMSAGNVTKLLAKTYNNLNDPSVTPCDLSGMLDTNYNILGSGSSAVGNATSYTLQTDPGLASLVGNVLQLGTITPYFTYAHGVITAYNSSTKVATVAGGFAGLSSTTFAGLNTSYVGQTQLVTDAISSGNCTAGGGSSTAFCAWNGSTYVATQYDVFSSITIASAAAGVSGATTTVTGINTNFTSTLHVGDGILGSNNPGVQIFSGLSNYESYVTAVTDDTHVTVVNSTGPSASTSVPSIYYYLPKWNSSTNTMCGWEHMAQGAGGFPGSQPIINTPAGGNNNVSSTGPGTGGNTNWDLSDWAVLDTVVAAATGGSETRATADLAMTFGAAFDYSLAYVMNSFSGFGQSGATYDKDGNEANINAWTYYVTQSFPTYPSMDLTGPWVADQARQWMFGQYPDSNGIDSGYSIWYLQYANQSSVASIGYPGIFGLTNAGMSLLPAFFNSPAVCAAAPNCPAQYDRNYIENASSMSNRWGGNGMIQETAALQVLHNSPTIVSTEYRTQPPQYAFIGTSQPTCVALTGGTCPVKFHQDAVISRGNTSGETYKGWSNQADTLVYHGSRSAMSDYYGPGETTLGIYKNGWILYDDVSTPGQVPTGYDMSIIGDTPCIGSCPVGHANYTESNSESVYGGTPAMMPITSWSRANHGSWTTSYGDQAGNYMCDASDISGLYDQVALGITISHANRDICHSKQAGQDEFIFDFLSMAATAPTVMETHLHYLNNGQTQLTPARSTGTTTYLGGNVIESVQSGGQIGTAPAQNSGLMTAIMSSGTITVGDLCVGHGGGQCAPGDTYPGGIGYSHAFVISGGSSVGAPVSALDVVTCHHVMKSLVDTTFTPLLITPDANWTGAQCSGSTSSAVALFARGGVTHAAITGFTTTHSGPAQYMFEGLTPGTYAVTIGGTPVTGSPFPVAANDNSLEFWTAGAGGVVALTSLTLSITTTSLPGGTVGVVYSPQTIGTANGTPPISWTVSAGTLCAGLTLGAATGIVAGTPTTTGTCSFTVQAVDSFPTTATQPLSIVVAPGLSFGGSIISTGVGVAIGLSGFVM